MEKHGIELPQVYLPGCEVPKLLNNFGTILEIEITVE